MNRKMRVLHLLASNRYSGAENVVCQIINIFRNRNVDMAYCSPDGQIRESLASLKIDYLALNKLSIKEVARVVNEYSPDIIHAHDIRASIIAANFSKKAVIIAHIHGNHQDMRKLTLKSFLFGISTYQIKKIIWVSQSAFDNYYFRNRVSDKSLVLYNVIDKDSVVSKMNDENTCYDYDIVYLGRLTYAKDPEKLVKLFKLVIEKNPDVKIAVIGTGDLYESTRHLIDRLGISSNISLLGFLDNPLKILHDAKVMVMTSRYEGTPMCALEAMALGVPIVSTPTDGMVELVENNVTGYLSDDISVLSEKINLIINDHRFHQQLSSNTTRKFDSINNLENYATILESAYKA